VKNHRFEIIVLGCTGGPGEANLSGYLISYDHQSFVAFDSGTLLHGLDVAIERGTFADFSFSDPELCPSAEILQKHIKAFLISHAHLDHISGLVVNSQADESKAIYATNQTIDHLRDHIFNGLIWPNYGNEGEGALDLYTYHRLALGKQEEIGETEFLVEPFLLSHPEPGASTAFLLEHAGSYLLLCGDTCSDRTGKGGCLDHIWKRVAPLIDQGQVAALLIECSFGQLEEGKESYGHLDSATLLEELSLLESRCEKTISGLNVVITHRKVGLRQDKDLLSEIEMELKGKNALGVNFIFPTQGERIQL